MFGMTQNPANAYAKVGLESSVMTADSHGLILLLFEGAATAIAQARIHMEQNDVAQRGTNISKAIDITSTNPKVQHGDITFTKIKDIVTQALQFDFE